MNCLEWIHLSNLYLCGYKGDCRDTCSNGKNITRFRPCIAIWFAFYRTSTPSGSHLFKMCVMSFEIDHQIINSFFLFPNLDWGLCFINMALDISISLFVSNNIVIQISKIAYRV